MALKHEKSLVWFRKNLRLQDNESLISAIQGSKEYLLLYVFDEDNLKETPINLPRSSAHKFNFEWECVEDLQRQILSLGGSLNIMKGNPYNIIKSLNKTYRFDAFYAPKEAGTFEKAVEKSLEKALSNLNVKVYFTSQTTLFHEDDIPWPINKLPDIFTQFRKENEKQTTIRSVFKTPDQLTNCLHIDNGYDLASLKIEDYKPSEKAVLKFQGGETAAWNRLNHYFWETDELQNYKFKRNGMLGPDYSSKFSPWLAWGCISPRSIYFEIKKYEKERIKNQSTYWLFFELIWRDYFHFVLKKFGSKLFQIGGIREEAGRWSKDTGTFERWVNGETGVPYIDANMRELKASGFMSNRGRQNAASFLVKDLDIDWRMGAWYFEYALIDYDVASNWGNWAYIAGVGNDPRENRYFNILSQARKYDPKGDYVRYWLPELEKVAGFNAHRIGLLSKKEYQSMLGKSKIDYFQPMVDLKKWEF